MQWKKRVEIESFVMKNIKLFQFKYFSFPFFVSVVSKILSIHNFYAVWHTKADTINWKAPLEELKAEKNLKMNWKITLSTCAAFSHD